MKTLEDLLDEAKRSPGPPAKVIPFSSGSQLNSLGAETVSTQVEREARWLGADVPAAPASPDEETSTSALRAQFVESLEQVTMEKLIQETTKFNQLLCAGQSKDRRLAWAKHLNALGEELMRRSFEG